MSDARCSAGHVPGAATAGRQQRRVHVGRRCRHVAAAGRLQRDDARRARHQFPATPMSHGSLALSAVPRAGALPTPPRYGHTRPPLWLISASVYRPLSAFKTYEITDVLRIDTLSALLTPIQPEHCQDVQATSF